MPQLVHMQTFVRVVEAGSITAAADVLNVAKSAVSRRLSELEGDLGVTLLNRTTRALKPTDTGQSYYAQCVRILDDIAEVEAAISEQAGALRGRIRLAAPMTFGLRHLTGAITEFMRRHPEIEFDIDFNDRRIDVVQDGFDIVIRIGDLPDSNLIARPLTRIRHSLCASPAYLERYGTPETPADVRHHRVLQYSGRVESSWRYTAPDGQEGRITVQPNSLANNGDFLTQAAIDGLGMALQPTFITYQAVQAGKLRTLLENYEWRGSQCSAVYPHTRQLSPRVRRFVDFLVERFAGTPYWDAPHSADTKGAEAR